MSLKKSLVTSSAALIGVVALAVTPALAANDKGVMYDKPSGSCSVGATGGTAAGFANLNDVNESVNGIVSLKNGNPDSSYAVYLIAADGSCTLLSSVGMLTTNGQGYGNLSVPATSVAGEPGWFVEAFNPATGDFIASPAQN